MDLRNHIVENFKRRYPDCDFDVDTPWQDRTRFQTDRRREPRTMAMRILDEVIAEQQRERRGRGEQGN